MKIQGSQINTNLFKKNFLIKLEKKEGFPGGSVVKNLPSNAGVTGSSPGQGKSHMPSSNKACAL